MYFFKSLSINPNISIFFFNPPGKICKEIQPRNA